MALHVIVFLLVVFFLLSLARLGRLDWLHLQPSHSRGRAIHSITQRLRHHHAPLLTAPPVVLPPLARRVEGQPLCLCDLGVR